MYRSGPGMRSRAPMAPAQRNLASTTSPHFCPASSCRAIGAPCRRRAGRHAVPRRQHTSRACRKPIDATPHAWVFRPAPDQALSVGPTTGCEHRDAKMVRRSAIPADPGRGVPIFGAPALPGQRALHHRGLEREQLPTPRCCPGPGLLYELMDSGCCLVREAQ